ncbi:MAG: diacylglycerol/polyprenol kinase family protein [Pseudobdellovibrio sp.]
MTETNITLSGFKNRSDLHIARKIWHVSGVFTMFTAWLFLPHWLSMTMLIVGWLMFVPMDIIRQKNPEFNRTLSNIFRPIMRSSELNRLAGTTYLLTGTLVITLLFNTGVVSLSLLFLAFADPIASYVGIKYGKDKIFGHKSVQGFIAAFAVCSVLCFIFLYYNQVQEHLLVVSLFAGLIGALAELIPLGKLDDNFSMPVLSSLGLSLLFYFFNFFPFFK